MPRWPVKAAQVVLELGAELAVLDVVDDALETCAVAHGHAAATGAQVRVVVRAVEEVGDAVVLGDDAEEAAHVLPPPVVLD